MSPTGVTPMFWQMNSKPAAWLPNASYSEKIAAERVALRVYGVKAVANDVAVRLASSYQRIDTDGFDVLAREHGALQGNATKTWAVLESSLATATRVPADS